jgi:hypothetical protein
MPVRFRSVGGFGNGLNISQFAIVELADVRAIRIHDAGARAQNTTIPTAYSGSCRIRNGTADGTREC